MFNISVPAAHRMNELLRSKDELAILRIVRRAGRFRLCVSQVREGDNTFAHGGRDLLVLDRATHQMLRGHSLNTRNTPAGIRLSLAPR